MVCSSHGRFSSIICLKWLPQAFLVPFLVPQPYNIKGKSIDGTWEELWQCCKPQVAAFNVRLGNLVVIA